MTGAWRTGRALFAFNVALLPQTAWRLALAAGALLAAGAVAATLGRSAPWHALAVVWFLASSSMCPVMAAVVRRDGDSGYHATLRGAGVTPIAYAVATTASALVAGGVVLTLLVLPFVPVLAALGTGAVARVGALFVGALAVALLAALLGGLVGFTSGKGGTVAAAVGGSVVTLLVVIAPFAAVAVSNLALAPAEREAALRFLAASPALGVAQSNALVPPLVGPAGWLTAAYVWAGAVVAGASVVVTQWFQGPRGWTGGRRHGKLVAGVLVVLAFAPFAALPFDFPDAGAPAPEAFASGFGDVRPSLVLAWDEAPPPFEWRGVHGRAKLGVTIGNPGSEAVPITGAAVVLSSALASFTPAVIDIGDITLRPNGDDGSVWDQAAEITVHVTGLDAPQPGLVPFVMTLTAEEGTQAFRRTLIVDVPERPLARDALAAALGAAFTFLGAALVAARKEAASA